MCECMGIAHTKVKERVLFLTVCWSCMPSFLTPIHLIVVAFDFIATGILSMET